MRPAIFFETIPSLTASVVRAGSHDIAIQFSGLHQLLQFLKFLSQLLQLLCDILRKKKQIWFRRDVF